LTVDRKQAKTATPVDLYGLKGTFMGLYGA